MEMKELRDATLPDAPYPDTGQPGHPGYAQMLEDSSRVLQKLDNR